jgi:hypothetical protein
MMTIKRTAFVLLISLCFHTGYAQVAQASQAIGGLTGGKSNMVWDPSTEMQLVTVVEEARKTYTVIKKELELLEEARKALAKVNNFVRQIKYLDDIIKIQKEIYKINQQSIDQARELKVLDKKAVLDLVEAMNNNLIAMESTLNLANHMLKDDFLEMSTAERIKALQEIMRESRDYLATARFLNRQIREYATLHFIQTIYGNAGQPFSNK